MLYSKCSHTPMQVFIDVQISRDLAHLVVSGEYDTEKLLETWEEIIEEYKILTKEGVSEYLFKLKQSVEYLDKRLVILSTILNWLKDRPSPAVAELLEQEFGYTFEGNVDIIWNKAKRDLHTLKIREAELNKYSESTPVDQTEQDWIDNMGILSQYQGFKFNSKTETVAEYISLLNRFKAEHKNGRK